MAKDYNKLIYAVLIFIISFVILYLSSVFLSFMKEIKLNSLNLSGDLEFQQVNIIYEIIENNNKVAFYDLDLNKLKREIEELPWIEKADLSRKWNGTLKISLIEKEPFALLDDGAIISKRGNVFYPYNLSDAELEILHLQLPKFFCKRNFLDETIANYFKIQNYTLPFNLEIKEIELMPDQGWRVLIGNNINLYLGSKELTERLNNFAVAYKSKLGKKIDEITYIDLRYTNGIAVK